MVLASCHGPTAPRQAQTLSSVMHDNDNSSSNKNNNNVIVQVLLPGNLRHSSEWEVFLTNVLSGCVTTENCPGNSVIQIVIQVQSDDGSVLPACVHASVSALMDASIELNYLPVAITCLISGNQDYWLDPTLMDEDQEQSGLLTMVVVNRCGGKDALSPKIGGIWSSGTRLSAEDILKCWNLAVKASSAVTAFWRMAFNHKHQQHAKTLFAGENNS